METNHGVIYRRKSTDWIAGKVGAIVYEVRLPSGDWSPFANHIRKEKQWFPKFDTMGCVSFSANSLCEMQILQQTGIEVNFSDRFLAKMSGTTPQGNWLYIVGDTLRIVGCVLEEEWPVPPNEATMTWDEYYAQVPMFVLNRAKPQFLDKYTIQTEWVDPTPANIQKHLKHAPLQFVIPGHAIAGIMLSATDSHFTYLDTYDPFIKTAPFSTLTDVYKILLTVKNKDMAKVINNNGTISIQFGQPGKEVHLSIGGGAETSKIFKAIQESGEPIVPGVPSGKRIGVFEDGPIIDTD